MKLSIRRIETEKPDSSKIKRIADGDGLYLKIVPNGTKTFVFRYTYGRGRQEITLGTYPQLTLAAARDRRVEQARLLGEGKNPILVKGSAVHAKRAALTVEQLGEEFKSAWLDHHYEQPADAYSRLKRDPIKLLGRRLVPDVSPEDITRVFNKMVERGSLVSANRTLPLTRLLFQYAVDQHYISTNPVTLTKKAAGGSEKAKTTALLLHQIEHVLSVLNGVEHRMSPQTRLGILVILGTAKRPDEVTTMEWSHVSFKRREWLNPMHLTKEKHGDHLVFLNDFTERALRQLQKITGDGRFVFRSPRWVPGRPETPIARHSLSSAILDLHQAGTIKVKFTPHDLRRTFSTRMADLGVAPHVVEKILDHLMTGTMAVYNRASYFEERKAAMTLWSKTLDGLKPSVSGN